MRTRRRTHARVHLDVPASSAVERSQFGGGTVLITAARRVASTDKEVTRAHGSRPYTQSGTLHLN